MPGLKHRIEAKLVRIFVSERARWHDDSLHRAIVDKLHKAHFSGVTVFRGVLGFGASARIHSAHLFHSRDELPVIIEVVDSPEHVEEILLWLDEMLEDGIVTVEDVAAIQYRHA